MHAGTRSEALSSPWYSDLVAGTGSAADLDPDLRVILAEITADVAVTEVLEARERALAEARASEARAVADRRAQQEREIERARAAREQTIREGRARAEDRGGFDWTVMIGAIVLSATVLVPWLIGRWLLRGQFFHPTAGGVYDIRPRFDETYFIADWLGGVAVLFLLAGTAVLIGRWRHRIGSVIFAFVLILPTLIFILPASNSSWSDAERTTADLLVTTNYPFSEEYATCGYAIADVAAEQGGVHRWQFHTAKSGSPDVGCNRIEIYDGWTYVASYTLPSGEAIGGAEYSPSWGSESGIYAFAGTSTADSGVIFTSSIGEIVGFVLASPDVQWRMAGLPEIEILAPSLAALEFGLGEPGGYVAAVIPTTGAVAWTVDCPADTGDMWSFELNADQTAAVFYCALRGGGGKYFSVDFAGAVVAI